MAIDNEELLREFLLEAGDGLERYEQELSELEVGNFDSAKVNSVFRVIHTLKGTSGFLDLKKLESVCHVGENLLDSVRSEKVAFSKSVKDALIQLGDALRDILTAIEENGMEGDKDLSGMLENLTALNADASSSASEEKQQATTEGTAEKVAQGTPGNEESKVTEESKEEVVAESGSGSSESSSERISESAEEITSSPDETNKEPESTAQELSMEDELQAIFLQAQQEYEKEKVESFSQEEVSQADSVATTPNDELQSAPLRDSEQAEEVSESEVLDDIIAEEVVVAEPQIATLVENSNPSNTEKTPQVTEIKGSEVVVNAAESSKEETPSEPSKKPTVTDTSLRIDVSLLDQLMNLVGELVLARNQILQFTKTQSDSSFVNTTQRLNLITSELQEGVMRTRMQPISTVWSKFPRVVRDISAICNKQVKLEMEGKETDLDKTLIEAIKDPLTHIVRNSVDHGIESIEKRIAAGKKPEGVLQLKAYHEGGSVIIEVSDDGAGMDSDRIRRKAVERGVITADRAAKMNEHEALSLIFVPGLSTAEKVTNISGRGVGMDVVRSNIERIGGTVDISSKLGVGTTLRIKIPLTLAIVPTLIVGSARERFAIPQANLIELVRVEGQNIWSQIEEINGACFYRLRGNLLPLIYLNKELHISPKRVEGEESVVEREPILNIVVVKADERTFGLVVDAVLDTEEIVVKPLSKQLKHLNVFAGATIMGDGHIALILDVLGLARRSGVLHESVDSEVAKGRAAEVSVGNDDRQSLLVVRVGEDMRAALPLELVSRLEESSPEAIEWSGAFPVVQYRGGILPLIDLKECFEGTTGVGEEERLQIVVYSHKGHLVGFVVDQILDIVQESVTTQMSSTKKGLLGSAVIQKKVTDMLNLGEIAEDRLGQHLFINDQEIRA